MRQSAEGKRPHTALLEREEPRECRLAGVVPERAGEEAYGGFPLKRSTDDLVGLNAAVVRHAERAQLTEIGVVGQPPLSPPERLKKRVLDHPLHGVRPILSTTVAKLVLSPLPCAVPSIELRP